MKKRNPNFLLWFMFIAMLVVIAAIVVFNLLFLKHDDWRKLLLDLMSDLLSAIVIGLFLGLVTKIMTDRLFSIQINMKRMRDFGIEQIGTGLSTEADCRHMFGHERPLKRYPHELKLLFLTGNKFLAHFKEQLIKALDEGCVISLLIASPEQENAEYLERCSFRYNHGDVDYIKEIKTDSLKTVSEIKQATKNPQNFKVRFYIDEYQNNVRIAKYYSSDNKVLSYYWINVQPLIKPAIDLSIALKGSIECYFDKENVDNKNNLCAVSEQGFDLLWSKYKDTEPLYEQYKAEAIDCEAA